VGLAGLPLDHPNTGTAVYVRNLAPLLTSAAPELEFRLFVRRPRHVYLPLARQVLSTPFGRLDQRQPLWARLDKLVWETVTLPMASALHAEDLLHLTYFAAPVWRRAKLVVTVHDLVPLAWPGYHRGRASRAYSRIMAWTVPRADAIITVSEHAKTDIARLLGVPESRIHVTYEAVDGAIGLERTEGDEDSVEGRKALEGYGLPDRFLLYIGGAEKRKNIETLVRAWQVVAPRMRAQEVRLLIVARFPPADALYPDIPRLIHDLGLEGDTVILPEVESAHRAPLYRRALALCFPSRYEGFGLTPLEAMASGTPVLAADATSLPEVVGDAGWLLPATDTHAWAEAMVRIVESDADRRALRDAGLRRSAEFSWEKTAAQTVAVYRQVLAR
jgi:glycosyltransferase involved in cell wall biosynthesis